MKKFLASLMVALLTGGIFTDSAKADVTYTIPQSVQQTLATNLACTGVVQNFNVQNLGQTQHRALIAWNIQPQSSLVQILGVDAAGNSTIISDGVNGQTPGLSAIVISAEGSYPIVRIAVTCATGGSPTFTLTYEGSSAAAYALQGTQLFAQLNKVIFAGVTAGAGAASNISIPPYGNSAGQILFQYSGGGPAGSTLQVKCGSALDLVNVSAFATFTFTLSTTGAVQYFTVPNGPCLQYTVNYNSGGASAVTVNTEYLFLQPGIIPSADPCQSPGVAKNSVGITAIATSTTQVVGAVLGQTVYPCGFQGSMSAAGAFQWEYGTGASCGTGTTTVSGVETTLSGQPILDGDAGQTIMNIPPGNALCIVTSVAGAFNGKLVYVQK